MLGRERYVRALEFSDPDSVPIHYDPYLAALELHDEALR